jgi:hypothetical protein
VFPSHYIKEGHLVVLAMAEDNAGRKMPFTFLSELQREVKPFATLALGPVPHVSRSSSSRPIIGMTSLQRRRTA